MDHQYRGLIILGGQFGTELADSEPRSWDYDRIQNHNLVSFVVVQKAASCHLNASNTISEFHETEGLADTGLKGPAEWVNLVHLNSHGRHSA